MSEDLREAVEALEKAAYPAALDAERINTRIRKCDPLARELLRSDDERNQRIGHDLMEYLSEALTLLGRYSKSSANYRAALTDLRILAEHPATPDSAADDTPPPAEYVWTRNDRADHDAGHPSGHDCDGDALGAGEACGHRYTPPPAEPDTGEVERLAALVHAKGWPDPVRIPLEPDVCAVCADSIRTARAVLASDWLAAHDQQVRAEALREAREDIKARRRMFALLNADSQYLSALDDAFGLVSNRWRDVDRIARGEAGQ